MLLISSDDQAYFQWMHEWYEIPRNQEIRWVETHDGYLFKVEWYESECPDLAKVTVTGKTSSGHIMTKANTVTACKAEALTMTQVLMWQGKKFAVHINTAC